MIIDSDISRLSIAKGEMIRLPKPAGATIAVMSGRLWLTQDHDARDIMLSPGDSFEIEGTELVLMEALEPAQIAVLPAVGQTVTPARSRAPVATPFRLPAEWHGGVGAWMPALPRHAI
ncbi:MAG: hypothetical protein RJA99_4314 [Pseudomonadota bacterium]|jgi:hypothetical protein